MKKVRKPDQGGFTLIEVLAASLILALASYSFLHLLKSSNYFAYKAKAEAKIGTLVRSRGGLLEGCSFGYLVWLVNNGNGGGAFSPVAGNQYAFQKGDVTGNGTTGFPFSFSPDPFGSVNVFPYGSAFSGDQYLLEARPLPGGTQRNIFPYQERVVLEFNDVPSLASSVNVLYEVKWRDDFAEGTPFNTFSLNFVKNEDGYDATP